ALMALVARQARDEILALVHHLGESVEGITVTEKIRAHGHDDVDGQLSLLGQSQYEADELGRLVTSPLFLCARVRLLVRFAEPAEAESLFKLIYRQQQVHV